jgi:hypothetical protein
MRTLDRYQHMPRFRHLYNYEDLGLADIPPRPNPSPAGRGLSLPSPGGRRAGDEGERVLNPRSST